MRQLRFTFDSPQARTRVTCQSCLSDIPDLRVPGMDLTEDAGHNNLIRADVMLTVHTDGSVELAVTVKPEWSEQVAVAEKQAADEESVEAEWVSVDADHLALFCGESYKWPLTGPVIV